MSVERSRSPERKHERMESKEVDEIAQIQTRPMSASDEQAFILETSTKKSEFLLGVCLEIEAAISKSVALKQALTDEHDLIEKVKGLQKQQQEIEDKNREMFLQNQESGLALQYLELSKEKRPAKAFTIDTPKRPKSSPPIKVALEKRPHTPSKSKTKEVMERRLEQAEKKREELLQQKLQALHQRDVKYAMNKERIDKLKAVEEEERKRKAEDAKEKHEKQKQKLLDEERQSKEKRRQAAEALKQMYDEQEAKYKGRVGEPAPIRDIHAQQKEKLDQIEGVRKAAVLKVKEERIKSNDTEQGERLQHLVHGEKVEDHICIKSLSEAKARKEKPEKFRTPQKKPKEKVGTANEMVLHSKIVAGIEKLKMRARSQRELAQLDADLQKENRRHINALTASGGSFFETEEKDDDLPALEKRLYDKENTDLDQIPLKLEFKLDDETSKKRRNKVQLDEEARLHLENSPFKPAEKKKSSRKLLGGVQQVKKVLDTDIEPSPLRKKLKPVTK